MSEADLSRREFLEKTAYTAGLAGMAGTVPIASLMSEAAEAQARRARLPSPRNVEIDHFVVLMMENRSFDHYFGWLDADADARQQLSYRNEQGQSVPTRHHSTLGSGGVEWKGCGHPDPGHGWESGRAQLNGGFLAKGADTDEFALTYFNRGELASSTPPRRTTPRSTAGSARSSPPPTPTGTTSGAPSAGVTRTTASRPTPPGNNGRRSSTVRWAGA